MRFWSAISRMLLFCVWGVDYFKAKKCVFYNVHTENLDFVLPPASGEVVGYIHAVSRKKEKKGGARDITVIIVGNGLSDSSWNPGWVLFFV